MPQTKLQNVVYTIIMAIIMVYGMICYNVALSTGGVTNATFGMALHELPIMAPIAAILEFFIVEKLATKLAFTVVRPTDRPQIITFAISTPHHEPDCHPAVQGAQLWHLGTDLGHEHAHGADLAAAVCRPADPADLPQPVPQPADRRCRRTRRPLMTKGTAERQLFLVFAQICRFVS